MLKSLVDNRLRGLAGGVWVAACLAVGISITGASLNGVCAAAQPDAGEGGPYETELRGHAEASISKAFFEPNRGSTFDAPIKLTDKPKVYMLPPERPGVKDEEEETAELAAAPADEAAPEAPKPIEERLAAIAGKPDEDTPILADEKAPKPLQAMMLAMQEGRDDLALKYGRQYVRYMRNVQNRVAMTTKLQKAAGVVEGVVPESQLNEEDPDYDGVRALLDKERAAKKAVDGIEESYGATLGEQAHSILAAAEAAEDKGIAGSANKKVDVSASDKPVKPLDEKTERLRIRREYTHKVPVSADGKVTVFVFFRLTDPRSHQALRALDRVSTKHRGDPRITTVGLSLDETSAANLVRFARYTEVKLPLRVGSKVASGIGIQSSPTFVFFSPGNDKVWTEVGNRQWYVLDEIVNVMQGGVR